MKSNDSHIKLNIIIIILNQTLSSNTIQYNAIQYKLWKSTMRYSKGEYGRRDKIVSYIIWCDPTKNKKSQV